MYRLELKKITRTSGRTVAAASNYATGERTRDRRRQRGHARTRDDVEASGLWGWTGTPSALWDAAEQAERRADAVTGREVLILIPREFDRAQAWRVVEQLAHAMRERWGVSVQGAMHAPKADDTNRHAHLLITSRAVSEAGEFGAKVRALDGRTQGPREVEWLRRTWAEVMNASAQAWGVPLPVQDWRSYARQGIDREPTHLPREAYEVERRGRRTRAGTHAHAAAERNALREVYADAAQAAEQEHGERRRRSRARRARTAAADAPARLPVASPQVPTAYPSAPAPTRAHEGRTGAGAPSPLATTPIVRQAGRQGLARPMRRGGR